MDCEKPAAIRLSGDNILEEHCAFENHDDKVTIVSMPQSITVSSAEDDPLIHFFLMIFFASS
jgi:hypothetical protein